MRGASRGDVSEFNLRALCAGAQRRAEARDKTNGWAKLKMLAEGEGFEPPVEFPPQWFSRPPPSTTRPSLRTGILFGNSVNNHPTTLSTTPEPQRLRRAAADDARRFSSTNLDVSTTSVFPWPATNALDSERQSCGHDRHDDEDRGDHRVTTKNI
jgi:hypothetical protein